MDGAARKIVIAGGGTGGHLFPALAVARELRVRSPGASIVFVGAERGIETRLVPAAGFPLRTLRLSGLKGSGGLGRIAAAGSAGWGVARSALWMLRERPSLVIGVGGYASGPAVLAARVLGVTTMILEQNHFPGATNRWLARRVDVVCVPSEAARARLGGRGVVTGNPVRTEFFALPDPPPRDRIHLLVFGGRRGARSINRAMTDAIPALASWPSPPRIVHQTGADDEAATRDAYARGYPAEQWEVRAFLDDMPDRIADADLVVCRAGATTLAELAAAGRPAILVPYPHAADDHQRMNAEAVRDAGAAVVIRDAEASGATLAGAIEPLARAAETREEMARAARALAVPDATARIADLAEALLLREDSRVPQG